MKRLWLTAVVLFITSACNDPAQRASELQSQIRSEITENEVFTTNPQGPVVAETPYVSSDEQTADQCKLYFSVSSQLPEEFYQSTEKAFVQHAVLDACVAKVSITSDLGRLYFSKNTPTAGGPSHHSATNMSDFLHSAFQFPTLVDAQAFFSCLVSGLSDYFNQATAAHGQSTSGYQAQESNDTLHVHYDLTVYTITSYVSQVVRIVEMANQFFVVFTSGVDGVAADAETYSHAGVKVTCQ